MKKNMKRARTLEALRMAIDFMMVQHQNYTAEYCPAGSACSDCICRTDDGECTCAPFMVSFYGYNHERLVSNWLQNSFTGFIDDCGLAKLAEKYFDIDIDHFMWGQTEKLLHRVRYIRVGTRDTVIDEEGYYYSYERGFEFDLYDTYNKLKTERYHEKWYNEPDIDKEWREGIF